MWKVREEDNRQIVEWGLESNPFKAIDDFSERKAELRWLNSEHRELYYEIIGKRFERIGNQAGLNRKKYYQTVKKPITRRNWEYLKNRKAWYIMPLGWDSIASNATTVVDFGCGDGDTIQRLIDHVNMHWKMNNIEDRHMHFVGIELNKSRIENAKKLVRIENPNITFEFMVGDLVKDEMGYEDKQFDYAISTAVLESLNDKDCDKFIRNMCRITRKGIYIEDILDKFPGGFPRADLNNCLNKYNFNTIKKHVILSEPFDVDRLSDPKKLWPIMLIQNIWAERFSN